MFLNHKIKFISAIVIFVLLIAYMFTIVDTKKDTNNSKILNANKMQSSSKITQIDKSSKTSHIYSKRNEIDVNLNEVEILKELEKHKNDTGTVYEEDIEQIDTPPSEIKERKIHFQPLSEETLGMIEEVEGLTDTSDDDNMPLEEEDIDPR